jgi:hypothetical protein
MRVGTQWIYVQYRRGADTPQSKSPFSAGGCACERGQRHDVGDDRPGIFARARLIGKNAEIGNVKPLRRLRECKTSQRTDTQPRRGRQTTMRCVRGSQAPTRRVRLVVGFSSLRSRANSTGEAARTTAKPSDRSSRGVRAARSTRRSMNWHVPSTLPPKAGGQKIGSAF